jgi:outer membrane murein-binding lipoprotein Lpp
MNRWREIPAWLLRAWPVLALIPVVAIHWIALIEFSATSQLVNKIIGMLLQTSGGLLVLYSINDNLGLFRSQSLLATVVTWLQSFPLVRRSVTVNLQGVSAIALAGSATASISQNFSTLEDLVKFLEQEVLAVRQELKAGLVEATRKLESVKSELGSRIDATSTKVTELTHKIERATVGGFKV